jgi:hypothetical protein
MKWVADPLGMKNVRFELRGFPTARQKKVANVGHGSFAAGLLESNLDAVSRVTA